MPNIKANGINIEYEQFGKPSDHPLLLIMGLGAQMILWRDEFCAALVERGHHVIRFDNRDVGKSTWFDSLGVPDVMATMTAVLMRQTIQAPYLLKDMAADAAALLDALGIERAHIVGASMGGMIAQTLAIEHPAKVRSLTSIMSSTGNPDLPQPKPEALGILLAPQPTTREESIERTVAVFRTIGSPGLFDEQEMRDVATRAYERGFNPAGVLRQLVAIVASGSRNEALRNLRVPTLVIHGKEDPLVPLAAGEDTAAAIPGAKLMAIDGMGHDMPHSMWPQMVDSICALTERAH